MLIKRRRGWELAEREATPEAVFVNRRSLIKAAGLGTLLAPFAKAFGADGPPASIYPAKRNEAYTLDRPVTNERYATNYNKFYEFGEDEYIAEQAKELKIQPWQVTIDGLVEKPLTLDLDDLLKKVQLEERLYRHRAVDAWSMAVPWTGFPLKALVALAKPLRKARFLRMETFMDPTVALGQRRFSYPWPYVESLTLAEATHELAFLVTGMYGKTVPKQNGAPLRLATPWKYGFKSIKSIVKFSFVEVQPTSFYETLDARAYGFWANVNPEVPNARWSQATEHVLGTNDHRPTLLFNGYAEQVAGLYGDLKRQWLYF